MLLLDHVGAKSAVKRTSPLLYLEDGPNLVILASKGGHPRHPAWFHNLRVSPETRVEVGSERRPVRARVATPDERRRLWPRAVKAYGGYADYQRRTGRRSRWSSSSRADPIARCCDSPSVWRRATVRVAA
jgi:deazaflavin-dependent oxidoreductase (nitroreductase family)